MGLHTVLDLNSKAMRSAATSEALQAHLDRNLKRKRAMEPRREYVGASGIGGSCERAIQFEFAGAPAEREISPDHLRKIAFGHLTEEWARWELKEAGFDVLTCDKRTRNTHVFSQLDGRFKGHPDGVIYSGPDVPGLLYPCLWEHKGVGSKTFNAVKREGLKKAKPQYYAQTAIYQAYLQFPNPAWFQLSNLDTGEQMHLLIPMDLEEAQKRSDLAVRIVKATEAGDLLPRPFKDPSHFVCKSMCDFPTRCWSLPQ